MRRGLRTMPSLGPMEILGILLIVVVIFGAGRLSGVGGALGRSIREFRREKEGWEEDTKQVSTKDQQDSSPVIESAEAEGGAKKSKKRG